MAEAKTREERETEWWQAWRDENYSWKGLADPKKNIGGDGGLHGERSLQNYWRRDPVTGEERDDETLRKAGELEKHGDDDWHIAHIPLHWPDGTPAKAAWCVDKRQLIARLIEARINATAETTVRAKVFREEEIEGTDGRAQLQGCVLPSILDHSEEKDITLHLAAQRCWLSDWNTTERRFGPGTRFDNAYFSSGADFKGSEFSGDARFDSAIFSANADFNKVVFQHHAGFLSVIFCKDAIFYATEFYEDTSFERALFLGYATFSESKLLGNVDFDSAQFERELFFRGAKFEQLVENIPKSGRMDFNRCLFKRAVDFRDVRFSQSCWLHGGAFLAARFKGIADFRGSHTHGYYRLSGQRVFTGWVAAMDQAIIETTLLIDDRGEAAFLQGFDKVVLLGVYFRSLSWLRRDRSNFRLNEGPGGAFEYKTKSSGIGVLLGRLLGHDELQRRPLTGFDLSSKKRLFTSLMDESVYRNRILRLKPARRVNYFWYIRENTDESELMLKQLESGCRVIKVAMGKVRNETMEHRFYRFQLLARRNQKGTPWPEKVASWIYSIAADYGLSLARPLAGVAAAFLLFAVAFQRLGAAACAKRGGCPVPKLADNATALVDPAAWTEALTFSASRLLIFGPFDLVSKTYIQSIKSSGGGWLELAVRGLATLESLIGVVLLFAFGLALRRRFQIG